MDQLCIACANHKDYPANILSHNQYNYVIEEYIQKLNEQENRLFCDEGSAGLDPWEHRGEDSGK